MGEADQRLSPAELELALANLPGWSVQAGKLHKQFQFADFGAALAFMVAGGLAAEKLNHHPEWTNVYNRVVVNLVTHDQGDSITRLDVALAVRLEACAGQQKSAL
ncbi:MAG: 4a-hydroxytetrahydrobiopterin dehydratase [Anaerolineales bacterium]|nr:4a-hydroxytetrahydrobiopterin dehydratase [Anaerolineales bacterium]MCB0017433.1 4a-hydroxytetrahydrobiopterin dehydratase [Anaerolineales bacterium]